MRRHYLSDKKGVLSRKYVSPAMVQTPATQRAIDSRRRKRGKIIDAIMREHQGRPEQAYRHLLENAQPAPKNDQLYEDNGKLSG